MINFDNQRSCRENCEQKCVSKRQRDRRHSLTVSPWSDCRLTSSAQASQTFYSTRTCAYEYRMDTLSLRGVGTYGTVQSLPVLVSYRYRTRTQALSYGTVHLYSIRTAPYSYSYSNVLGAALLQPYNTTPRVSDNWTHRRRSREQVVRSRACHHHHHHHRMMHIAWLMGTTAKAPEFRISKASISHSQIRSSGSTISHLESFHGFISMHRASRRRGFIGPSQRRVNILALPARLKFKDVLHPIEYRTSELIEIIIELHPNRCCYFSGC